MAAEDVAAIEHEHWRAEYYDALRTLWHQGVLECPSHLEGAFTFDVTQASLTQIRFVRRYCRKPCSAAYLRKEEATALWRQPTVKLQYKKCCEPSKKR